MKSVYQLFWYAKRQGSCNMISNCFWPLFHTFQKCLNHSTITLMLHTIKLLLKLTLQHLRAQIRPEIWDNLFVFIQDRTCKQPMQFSSSERTLLFSQDLYLAFIDDQKAFSKVCYRQFLEMPENLRVYDKHHRNCVISTTSCKVSPNSLRLNAGSGKVA